MNECPGYLLTQAPRLGFFGSIKPQNLLQLEERIRQHKPAADVSSSSSSRSVTQGRSCRVESDDGPSAECSKDAKLVNGAIKGRGKGQRGGDFAHSTRRSEDAGSVKTGDKLASEGGTGAEKEDGYDSDGVRMVWASGKEGEKSTQEKGMHIYSGVAWNCRVLFAAFCLAGLQ